MTEFTGIPCPICEKKFTETEKPAICPDCGAPFHRDCYIEKKNCPFVEKHGVGFTWNKPKPIEIKQEKSIDEISFKEMKEFISRAVQEQAHDGVKPDEQMILGVYEKEIAFFRGGIDALNLMKFRQIAQGRRMSFNPFAGFFSPLYMFYSRMRGPGFLIALVIFIFNLPSLLVMSYGVLGVELPFNVSEMAVAANLFNFGGFTLMVLIALFYDYFYLNWMVNKIKQMRSRYFCNIEYPEEMKLTDMGEDYYRYLQNAGRPGVMYLFVDGIAVSVLQAVLLYIIMFIM